MNTQKEKVRKDRPGKPPWDEDARRGAKGTRGLQDARGEKIKKTEDFFGILWPGRHGM